MSIGTLISERPARSPPARGLSWRWSTTPSSIALDVGGHAGDACARGRYVRFRGRHDSVAGHEAALRGRRRSQRRREPCLSSRDHQDRRQRGEHDAAQRRHLGERRHVHVGRDHPRGAGRRLASRDAQPISPRRELELRHPADPGRPDALELVRRQAQIDRGRTAVRAAPGRVDGERRELEPRLEAPAAFARTTTDDPRISITSWTSCFFRAPVNGAAWTRRGRPACGSELDSSVANSLARPFGGGAARGSIRRG